MHTLLYSIRYNNKSDASVYAAVVEIIMSGLEWH